MGDPYTYLGRGGGEKAHEDFLFNVPIKRRGFSKEASRELREVVDEVLSLTISLYKSSPLAFSAYALFVLFPKILLRPLPGGC